MIRPSQTSAGLLCPLKPSLLIGCLASFCISACGGEAASRIDPAPTVVHGTVVDDLGAPYAEIRVRIGTSYATTDRQGRFEITNVGDTYDAVVVPPDGSPNAYLGMSSRKPVFRLVASYAVSDETHTVRVRFHLPEPATDTDGATELLSVAGAQRQHYGGYDEGDVREYWIHWRGPQSTTLTAHSFKYHNATPSDTFHYVGHDTLQRSVTAGDMIDWDVSWKPLSKPEVAIRVEATLPSGYGVGWARAILSPEPGSSLYLPMISNDDPLSVLVPDIPGATYGVHVTAYSSVDGSSSTRVRGLQLPQGSPVTVQVVPGPRAIAPEIDVKDVDTQTEFRWQNQDSGTGFVIITPDASEPFYPSFYVFTAGTSARIPDTSDLGIPLPRGAKYAWAAFRTSVASIDELAAIGTEPEVPTSYYAHTGYQAFTTK